VGFEVVAEASFGDELSRHMGGIDARPREYEQRVVGFFDEAL
jgi:hypothetical protein